MKKKYILKNKKEIDLLFSTGKYLSNNSYTIKYLPVENDTKILFTTSSKKYKNATDRNLIKRRLKMIVSKLNIPTNKNIAIIYKNDSIISFEQMFHDLKTLFILVK